MLNEDLEAIKKVIQNPLTDYDNLADALFVEVLHLQMTLEMIQLGILVGSAHPEDIINLINENLKRPNPKLRRVIDDCRRSVEKIAREFREGQKSSSERSDESH